jgi:hypothetical protein
VSAPVVAAGSSMRADGEISTEIGQINAKDENRTSHISVCVQAGGRKYIILPGYPLVRCTSGYPLGPTVSHNILVERL